MLLQRQRRVSLTHDMHLIRGSVGAQAVFLPIRRGIPKHKTKQKIYSEHSDVPMKLLHHLIMLPFWRKNKSTTP